jgi:DNA-binding response OmpR family regulator
VIKFLIVDDEQGIVEEIKEFFTEEGYEVHTAGTGEHGIEAIKNVTPDIAMIDLKLPDMSGLLVLKVAKELHPLMKVIVNTGYVDQRMTDQALELGCDVFLHKPFDLAKLKEEVDRLIG